MIDNKENLIKSFSMFEDSMAKMWDMSQMIQGSLYGTQDQLDNITRKQLDQNKTAREEAFKVGQDMSKQIRKNQEQFQKIVAETVMNNYEQIDCTNKNLLSELPKKVDDLSNFKGGDLVDHMMTPLKKWLIAQSGNSPAN